MTPKLITGSIFCVSRPPSRPSPRGGRRGRGSRWAAPGLNGVHADAVAEQSAAALAPRRVDADDGDLERVALVQAQAAYQFVGQARLAGATGAGDAEHRRQGVLRGGMQSRLQGLARAAVLQCGDELRECAARAFSRTADRRQLGRCKHRQVGVAAHHHLADHAGQAHALAVFGAVDARHAMALQFGDLARHDHAAATTEHLDLRAAAFAQQVDHVLEVLDVTALIAADRDALHVFLQGRGHDLVDRTVVTEVDHFGTHALQDAPHDVDGRVMPVEQARRGDEAHLVLRPVRGQGLEFGGQVGHGACLRPVA
jgi:hypothetical protein